MSEQLTAANKDSKNLVNSSPWWAWVLFVIAIAVAAGMGTFFIFSDGNFASLVENSDGFPLPTKKVTTPTPTPTAIVTPEPSDLDMRMKMLEEDLDTMLETDEELEQLPAVDFELGI